MTPIEFRESRRKLGLSLSQMATILDVSQNTVMKWENDGGSTARAPNPVACRALSWMLAGFRPPEWPDELRGAKAGRPAGPKAPPEE